MNTTKNIYHPPTSLPRSMPNYMRQDFSEKCTRLQEDVALMNNLASHTLKSPLNIITNYYGLLEEKFKEQPASEEQVWISAIHQQTERMRNMVAAIFDYLSIELGSDKPRSVVDCNQILSNVLTNFNNSGALASATIHAKPLPVVIGKEKQLGLVFTHLIDNAIKFKSSEPLVINISATRIDDMVQFAIRDNGIGIEEEYTDIIFGLFQKLHTDEKYPGLGIGLALCKKIIQCSGGNIWVESHTIEQAAESPIVENGSTFYFTLQTAASNEA